jgi:hypothetical protein
MMLYLPKAELPESRAGLGVVHTTLHCALRTVPQQLTPSLIAAKCRLAHAVMKDGFGVETPQIGVCALNPHAGEEDLFGDEETRIIAPAVGLARAAGIAAAGPLPADTLMLRARSGEFDAVVAMYHDQGHIAIKLLGMHRAVNVTLGLPIVRTSVAHGTACSTRLAAPPKPAAWSPLCSPPRNSPAETSLPRRGASCAGTVHAIDDVSRNAVVSREGRGVQRSATRRGKPARLLHPRAGALGCLIGRNRRRRAQPIDHLIGYVLPLHIGRRKLEQLLAHRRHEVDVVKLVPPAGCRTFCPAPANPASALGGGLMTYGKIASPMATAT